jgi:sulfotransferase family protein
VTGERRDVAFVGGTRFSGAEAVAELLAARSDVTALSAARFHSDPWGISALLHGRFGIDDFATWLRAQEIAERVPSEVMDGALVALKAGYGDDPIGSCRVLFWTLVDELVEDAGEASLVDESQGNLLEAQTLLRLVPGARFVHVARDGRDVAAAAAESDEVGVNRFSDALEWWTGELREIERGLRGEEDGAAYAIPPERLSVLVSDELTVPEGGTAYARVLERLPLREDGSVPDSPSPLLDPAAIGRGAWRSRVRGPGRWWATRRYERALDELEAEGNHAAPALRAAYDRLG